MEPPSHLLILRPSMGSLSGKEEAEAKNLLLKGSCTNTLAQGPSTEAVTWLSVQVIREGESPPLPRVCARGRVWWSFPGMEALAGPIFFHSFHLAGLALASTFLSPSSNLANTVHTTQAFPCVSAPPNSPALPSKAALAYPSQQMVPAGTGASPATPTPGD